MGADLVNPGFGLVFWTTIAFLVILFLLKKFAWGPILESLKAREESIQNSLDAVERAKEDMALLQANIEDAKKEARDERDKLLKEARDTKDKIISDAKAQAQEEADRLVVNAREAIANEKMAAISELKNQVAALSIKIAEKLLKEELGDEAKQSELVNNLIEEVRLN